LTDPNGFGDQPVAAASRDEYEETKLPTLVAGAQDTLDAAVTAGNPIAQFQKGLVQLQAGQMEEGARLIRLAANRNQPAAQYRLAKLYESGTGIAKDPITARELIERAARGGNRIAMHDLGNYHAYGQGGLTRDMGEALEWFTKAAERGVVDSQFNVAFLREGNEGVSADVETALFWYFIAARQGDQGAPERIALLSEQFDAAAIASIKSRADRFNPKPVDEAANGIFRNVPWAQTPLKSAAVRDGAAQSAQIIKIREAQTLLSALGYEVGEPDGISGSKTRDAVKSFEAVNGMDETGQITDELLQKLEIATGA
jgi:localization factor PodJL